MVERMSFKHHDDRDEGREECIMGDNEERVDGG